jgi:acetyl esterase/lipase
MNEQINALRRNFETLGTVYAPSEKVVIYKENIEGVGCYWFHPAGTEESEAGKLIIYLHGGAFVFGSIASHRALVSHVAEQLALPVLFVEYSLAPEKPFPASVDDVEKVYRQIRVQYPEKEIILMGDSAGGGLAVTALSRQGMEAPAGLVLLSPWMDLTCSYASQTTNRENDPILRREAIQQYGTWYMGDARLSEANPIETINGQFPPTLILVGSGEILLDDSKVLYDKFAYLQNRIKLTVYENANHVWMLENIHSEASQKALREIVEFIDN